MPSFAPLPPGFRKGHIALDDHLVHFVEGGKGPPMLFLHNGGATMHIWEPLLARFSRSYRVCAMDHLGFGESQGPHDTSYSLSLWSRAVHACIEELGLDNATLVGNCLGSATALRVASEGRKSIRALILCHTLTETTLLAGPFGMLYKSIKAFPPVAETLRRTLGRTPLAPSLRTVALSTLVRDPRSTPAWLKARIDESFRNPRNLRSLLAILEAMDDFAALDTLKKREGFPYVVSAWGTRNRILPLRGGERFHEAFQPDKVEVLTDGSHLFMSERPDETARLIEDALAKTA